MQMPESASAADLIKWWVWGGEAAAVGPHQSSFDMLIFSIHKNLQKRILKDACECTSVLVGQASDVIVHSYIDRISEHEHAKMVSSAVFY